VGNFNTPLSIIGYPDKKINKEILQLNDTINLMELKDSYRVFHPATAQNKHFSEAHRTFSKIDHILGHKQISTNVRKLK
jgi:hypothetical protein